MAVENCTIVENCGLLVGRLNGIGTLEKSMGVPQKLKIELSYDPAIPLLHVNPKALKSRSQRDIYIPMSFAALFTTAKIWKQSKC